MVTQSTGHRADVFIQRAASRHAHGGMQHATHDEAHSSRKHAQHTMHPLLRHAQHNYTPLPPPGTAAHDASAAMRRVYP